MPAFTAPIERWSFTQPSPLGEVTSSYELSAQALHFVCDASIGPQTDTLRWDEIGEAATAVLDLPYGRGNGSGRGGPDMAAWIPGRLEWLLLSRPNGPAFMRPLPEDGDRDAMVSALQQRLGARWIGERLPLEAAQRRFRLSGGFGTLKIVGLVLAVLALMALSVIVFALAASLLLLPAGFLFGGWIFRRGLIGLRDTLHMANLPLSRASSAAIGRVELEGRVVAERSTPAGASGRPSVWWDLTVEVWSDDRDDGGWQQVLARHGGTIDGVVLEDDTGRMPIWLRDADLLLRKHTWESGKTALPDAGVALLADTAFPWHGPERLRVRETRMETGATVYVHGTLDEARHLTTDDGRLDRLGRALADGSWRPALLKRVPALLRAPVGVTIAYFDLMGSVGRGGARRRTPHDAPRPALPPTAMVVWKGRGGHSLLVADQREGDALRQLRQRSLWTLGIGIGLLCLCLHELLTLA